MINPLPDSDEIYDKHRQLSFKAAQERDKRRFDAADMNKDGQLDKKEYGVFLHPRKTCLQVSADV